MAWAGCNASGNGGLGVELWVLGAIFACIVSGEYALTIILLGAFVGVPLSIMYMASLADDKQMKIDKHKYAEMKGEEPEPLEEEWWEKTHWPFREGDILGGLARSINGEED